MSFISSMLIGMIEKELSEQEPEVEQYMMELLGEFATDLFHFVEKKTGIAPQKASTEENSEHQ